ncbi:MAG: DUF1330 domain-containing protein [Spirochaetota bacterium]|nr:DUF1330 domain-containing protein [Spirochaetota bacterium]
MKKGYWVVTFRKVKDEKRLQDYREIAGPALKEYGAKALVRGIPAVVHELGMAEQVVILEFPSLDQAIRAHDSREYQDALKVLGDAVERDIRIIDGIEQP